MRAKNYHYATNYLYHIEEVFRKFNCFSFVGNVVLFPLPHFNFKYGSPRVINKKRIIGLFGLNAVKPSFIC